MNLTMHVGLLAGVSALSLSGASLGGTTTGQTDNAALRAEIDALKAQVAQLSTGDNWLTEQRAEEVRGLVQDVLADADTRASLLQSGMTAGYDDGFVLGSTDGNFTLRINGQLQTRFVYNNQDNGLDFDDLDSDLDDLVDELDDLGFDIPSYYSGDDNRWGFENTRTKLIFSGNVVSPDWMYKIEGNFSRYYGDFLLEDAWIAYNYGEGWTVMMGQFKAPHQREWNVNSSEQLLVERSVLGYLSNGGRTQGIAFDYMADQFHFVASYNDGAYTANSPWSMRDTEWSFSGRVDFLAQGTWDQFEDFTSPQGSEMGMLFGGGFHYENGEYGDSFDELELLVLTGDASLEGDGWNAFAAVNYVSLEFDSSSVDLDMIGFLVQGGFYLNEDWEAFARYEWNDYDIDGLDDLSLITVGVNHYFNDNVKWTTDVAFGLDSVLLPADITGFRTDSPGEDGQMVIRSQFQLVF